MAVDLPREFDLGVVDVFQTHVGPGQPEKLGHPSAGERGQSEQRPPRLVGCGDRLLELSAFEDPRRLDCPGFGRSEDSISDTGLFQTSRVAAPRTGRSD